jgi:hypothetical protein
MRGGALRGVRATLARWLFNAVSAAGRRTAGRRKFLRTSPNSKLATARTRKTMNWIFAMPVALAVMPLKPSVEMISAMTRTTTA